MLTNVPSKLGNDRNLRKKILLLTNCSNKWFFASLFARFFSFAFQYLQKIVNIRLFKNDSLIEFYLNIFFQIGRRIRDSCRNLRGKHPSGGASSNPDDFSTLQAPNVSSQKKMPHKKKFIIFFFCFCRRVIDLCIMCLWIFRGNQVGLSVQKISKAKGPKMATLIFDGKSKPAMSIIYWQRLRPTSTKNSLGFIKV